MTDNLSVAHRLLRNNGYDHVVRAENVTNSIFKVFFVRNSMKNARLGIIVGKRTFSAAVDRNYSKRIIREAFRRHGIKQCNLDVVVLVKCPISKEDKVSAESLTTLFNRIENRCAE